MIRMTAEEASAVKKYGKLTVDQARSVARLRACGVCGGSLVIDTDGATEEDSRRWGTPLGRLLCLQGGHEVAELKPAI